MNRPLTDNFGKLTAPSTLTIQRWLPGPVDRLWSYLTDSDKRAKWLAAGDMSLAPGAPLELVWRNKQISDANDPMPAGFAEEQRMQTHIISAQPMQMLSFAWGAGTVTFELTPKDDKVLLTVTHTGLSATSGLTQIAAGWHIHLDIMEAVLTGTKAPSFWSGWTSLHADYTARLAD